MEAKAVARHVRMSPRKVRRVVDMVRGKSVDEALTILKYVPHIAAEPVSKVVASAAANAENNGSDERRPLHRPGICGRRPYAQEGPAKAARYGRQSTEAHEPHNGRRQREGGLERGAEGQPYWLEAWNQSHLGFHVVR